MPSVRHRRQHTQALTVLTLWHHHWPRFHNSPWPAAAIALTLAFVAVGRVDAHETQTSASSTKQRISAQYLPLDRFSDAFAWGLHMDTDAASNHSGGISSGSAYDTVVHAGFAFDPEKLGWWTHGRFHVDVAHIQSDGLSRRRVGDTQGVSNLEAASANRLYSAWYEHKLGNHDEYRLGIIDLNAYFDVTEAAGGLMNSSFGVSPTISANIPASIYPKPGYGAMAESTGHRWQFRAGVFQGDPRDRSSVWSRGRMIVAEAARSNPGRFGGLYKLGAWQYRNPQAAASDAPSHTWGLYGVIVQPISRRAPYRDSRLFVQLGANPGGGDNVPYYLGFGADFFNPISGRPKDRISVGVARAWLQQGRAETTYEITYLYRLNRWLYLQPDLQYVHSPSGVLPNALVALLRAHFEFGD